MSCGRKSSPRNLFIHANNLKTKDPLSFGGGISSSGTEQSNRNISERTNEVKAVSSVATVFNQRPLQFQFAN